MEVPSHVHLTKGATSTPGAAQILNHKRKGKQWGSIMYYNHKGKKRESSGAASCIVIIKGKEGKAVGQHHAS